MAGRAALPGRRRFLRPARLCSTHPVVEQLSLITAHTGEGMTEHFSAQSDPQPPLDVLNCCTQLAAASPQSCEGTALAEL